jgi:hypothetical protein
MGEANPGETTLILYVRSRVMAVTSPRNPWCVLETEC